MNLVVKLLGLCLFIISYNAFGNGDLTVTNTTLGIVRFKIVRTGLTGTPGAHGWTLFRSPAIAPGEVLARVNFLNTGDQITFPVADNTRGPLLPEAYIVGSLHGRTADVIMTCKSDNCDITEY